MNDVRVDPGRADPEPGDVRRSGAGQRSALSHPGPPPCASAARSTQPGSRPAGRRPTATWKPSAPRTARARRACRARCRRAPGRTTPTAAPRARVPSQPGNSTSGSIIPLKKIAERARSSPARPTGSSSQNAVHRDEEADREADHDRERERRPRSRPRASGEAGQRDVEEHAARSAWAPSPRVSRWYAARPRSPARYQPTSPTGR